MSVRGLLGWMVLSCAACSFAPPARLDDGGSGVRIENHVGYPFELQGLWLVLDGESIVRDVARTVHEPNAEGFLPIRLSPGLHRIDTKALVQLPCGLGGEVDMELRAAKSFVVGDEPARIEVAFFTHGPLTAFEHAPDVALTLRGAEEVPLVPTTLPSGYVRRPGDDGFSTAIRSDWGRELPVPCGDWPPLEPWGSRAKSGR